MSTAKHTWGIWGLGTVGKSAIRHLHASGHTMSAYDTRTLSLDELRFLDTYSVRLYQPSEQALFIQEHEFIIPSPGVNAVTLAPSKRISELDLFRTSWKKPLITVTGSLGKTTLVTALDQILHAHGVAVATGGNIGTAMLDLLEVQEQQDCGLLELSSFQLEYAHRLAPDFAIWTTFHPNHLDRHATVDNYFMAKYRMLEDQSPDQKALLPFSLLPKIRTISSRSYSYFSLEPVTEAEKNQLQSGDILYTLEHTSLIKISKKTDGTFISEVISISSINNPLHAETWLCALATSDILGLTKNNTISIPELTHVAHRIECVGTYKGIILYNDSKSTIIESTIAAAQKLSNHPVHLLLGGVSKGIDRTRELHRLKNLVKSITCFGAEARELSHACTQMGIASKPCATLPEALLASLKNAQPQDVLLLSPGGASFDLYKNYEERGAHFKELISRLP